MTIIPILHSRPSSENKYFIVAAAILLLRSRIARIPQDFKAVTSTKQATQEELQQASQQVYTTNPDGSKSILVAYRNRISTALIHPISPQRLANDASHFPPIPVDAKPGIDAAFLRQLRAILLRVAFPSLKSKETLIVILHSFFLVLRTVLSIAVARLDGRIVRDLVSADGPGFIRGLGLWFLLAIPSTYTNSMIRHLQSKLSLRLRTRLTRYIHDLYLSSSPHLRYYRCGIEGVDQYITADVESWADALAGLYGNLLKPSLDMLLFTTQLSRSLGARGTVLLFVNYYATARILRAVTPAFGKLAAVEAKLEGDYRRGVGRVERESEEIAFYDGGATEKAILTSAYMKLIKHINSIYKIRIAYEWTEDYVIKYLWSAAGYSLIAVPLLFTRRQRAAGSAIAGVVQGVAVRTETYISNRRLLVSLADAGGRLMYAYKDLLELAGLTGRVYTLLSALHSVEAVHSASALPSGEFGADVEMSHVDVVIPSTSSPKDTEKIDTEKEKLAQHNLLVKDLSFALKEGDHLMITGSNGVGKTAVARVLAGLWEVSGGWVRKPEVSESLSQPLSTPFHPPMLYIPQRAYLPPGTLLDQVIYPLSYADFIRTGGKVEELAEVLESVFLGYLVEREGGWGTRKVWGDVLSGGEKQRMGMARVFFHRPKFAVLDECTSAVSSDVEGRVYEHAKTLGITLITISLRPSLMRYHTHLLTLTGAGDGSWTFEQVGLGKERAMGLEREIESLEQKLGEVRKWEERVKTLEGMLGTAGYGEGDDIEPLQGVSDDYDGRSESESGDSSFDKGSAFEVAV